MSRAQLLISLRNMKLIMLRGLPASGKSTLAVELMFQGGDYFRVNRDLLRTMLHNNIWTGKREGVTVDVEKIIVAQLLSQNKNVIVDDTNLGDKHVDMWKSVAIVCGAKFEIIDMMDKVTVAECIERNQGRIDAVPPGVIEGMALQYNYLGLTKIVVVDIDGTVADGTHRQHHLAGEKKDWKTYFSLMSGDTPRHDVYEQAVKVAEDNYAEIVFVSARPEDYRMKTEQWLRENGMTYKALIMRPKGNKNPDTQVKGDIYERYLKQYTIVRVFDDRPSVIRMWREKGLEVEDVGNGIEF